MPTRAVVFLAALLSVLIPGAAQALTFSAGYTISFDYPPNPCVDGSTLGGDLEISYGNADGPLGIVGGAVTTARAACGGSVSGAFAFDPGLVGLPADEIHLYASFAGSIESPDPGPPESPVYAFAAGTLAPPNPVTPPEIYLGPLMSFALPNPGPPDLPLFAFALPEPGLPDLPFLTIASPGTRVGTLSLDIAPVPLPGTLLLLGSGLAAALAGRRKTTPKR